MINTPRGGTSFGPARSVRVLVILNSGAVNGAVRQLAHWLPALDTGRFDAAIAFLRDAGPLGSAITPPGARVFSDILKHRWDLAGAWRLLVRARRLHPDMVFSIDERNATILSRMVGKITGARVINAVHSFPSSPATPWWDRLTRGWVWRFIALSASHKAYLAQTGIADDRITIVENGVGDQAPAQRPGGQAMVVAFVGVLRPDKRVDLLFEAVAALASEAPDLTIVVAGDGPERERLHARGVALGIDDRISWRGWVADIEGLLRGADVLVLPSDPGVEALSMAALEAMAVGLPVVATDVGSMRDAVTSETGFLVPPGDAGRLADALRALYRDPGLRARLGRAGWHRQRSRFSASRLPDQMIDVLVEAAAGRASPEGLRSVET